MVAVDWSTALDETDSEGLVTPANKAAAVHLCQEAEARLRIEFPVAYRGLQKEENLPVLVGLVRGAVLRVLRNSESGGIAAERDGVYSYTFSALTQSPDIWWTNSDRNLLAALSPSQFALGPLHRGGLSG